MPDRIVLYYLCGVATGIQAEVSGNMLFAVLSFAWYAAVGYTAYKDHLKESNDD